MSEQGFKERSILLPHFFHLLLAFSLGEMVMLSYVLAGIGSFIGQFTILLFLENLPTFGCNTSFKKKIKLVQAC